MTSKADSLVANVTRLVPCSMGSRESIDALVCYIEELERKAAAYDAMQASLSKFDELFRVRETERD